MLWCRGWRLKGWDGASNIYLFIYSCTFESTPRLQIRIDRETMYLPMYWQLSPSPCRRRASLSIPRKRRGGLAGPQMPVTASSWCCRWLFRKLYLSHHHFLCMSVVPLHSSPTSALLLIVSRVNRIHLSFNCSCRPFSQSSPIHRYRYYTLTANRIAATVELTLAILFYCQVPVYSILPTFIRPPPEPVSACKARPTDPKSSSIHQPLYGDE